MSEDIKTFSTPTLLSVLTGRFVGVAFDDIHAAIEHLLGEPVWTHQLASPGPWEDARKNLTAQHPVFASIDDSELSVCDALDGDACQAVVDEWQASAVAIVGSDELTISRGHGRSVGAATIEAFRSLTEMAKDKPLVVLSSE
jgi:hypothetical protein